MPMTKMPKSWLGGREKGRGLFRVLKSKMTTVTIVALPFYGVETKKKRHNMSCVCLKLVPLRGKTILKPRLTKECLVPFGVFFENFRRVAPSFVCPPVIFMSPRSESPPPPPPPPPSGPKHCYLSTYSVSNTHHTYCPRLDR